MVSFRSNRKATSTESQTQFPALQINKYFVKEKKIKNKQFENTPDREGNVAIEKMNIIPWEF